MTSRGLRVTDIELLTKFRIEECRSYTYRVAIKAEDYDKALDPRVWPHRVGIRIFKNKRTQTDLLSQNQQSNRNQGINNHNGVETSTPVGPASSQPSLTVNTPLEVRNRFVAAGFASEVTN